MAGIVYPTEGKLRPLPLFPLLPVRDLSARPDRVARMASLAPLTAPVVAPPSEREAAPARSPAPERMAADSAASCAAQGVATSKPIAAAVIAMLFRISPFPQIREGQCKRIILRLASLCHLLALMLRALPS